MHRKRTRVLVPAAVAALLAAGGVVALARADAHGSMQSPVSRAYACYQEGPEAPRTPACQAAVAAGGSQPLYDWNEVNLPDAAGRHRQVIPDGKLCSAGRDKYRGLDLARADWPATTLTAGAPHSFAYKATAPHKGGFELYVTRDGWDPTQPLRWSDLDATPFLRATDPPLSGGAYVMDSRLPAGKSGRHLIYGIWQRSDSPEAFYTCSDVVFGGGGGAPTTPAPTTTTTTTRPPVPAPTTTAGTGSPAPAPGAVTAWSPWTAYRPGDVVTYGGTRYGCRQGHTSQPDWAPRPETLALWLPLDG
jgi:predicted carbohydrate-binding protein with CBM5 and CBM33 domain